jgi:hypothetical protein
VLPISLRSIEHGAHVKDLVSIDFFTVPAVTFRVLFVLLILSYDLDGSVHFNVTSSPSAEWAAQQMGQAFPEETAPRYLLRDLTPNELGDPALLRESREALDELARMLGLGGDYREASERVHFRLQASLAVAEPLRGLATCLYRSHKGQFIRLGAIGAVLDASVSVVNHHTNGTSGPQQQLAISGLRQRFPS